MNVELLLTLLAGLISILLTIIAWIGNGMVTKLETISKSLQKIEQDFSVLNNDHANLKTDVIEIKQRVKELERA